MMNKILLSCFVVTTLLTGASAQEFEGVKMYFIVSNATGRSETVTLGIAKGASTGLDQTLGEAEIPPQPPAEIFDARATSTPGKSQLGAGSLTDLRAIASSSSQFTETYTIAYQCGINATSVKMAWAAPYPARVVAMRIDGADAAGKTEVTTSTGKGLITLEITFNYKAFALTATPPALDFVASNRGPLPMKTVDVIPDGDPNAMWNITPDVPWLDVFPASGTGRQTVEVSVIDQRMAAGNYTAALQLAALAYPVQRTIPVNLTFIVGVGRVSPTNEILLSQNYPNPIDVRSSRASSAFIELTLGSELRSAAAPTLTIHNLLGTCVADLSNGVQPIPGVQRITFDARELPAGIYRYRLQYGAAQRSRIMIVL